MTVFRTALARMGLAAIAASTLLSTYALAGPRDYRFELVQTLSTGPNKTEIVVRLVHTPDGKAVSDAVVYQTKLDMGPDGMASMTAPVKALPSTQPGLYRFEAGPEMAGKWGLTIAARVQGESEPIRGTVVVPVEK